MDSVQKDKLVISSESASNLAYDLEVAQDVEVNSSNDSSNLEKADSVIRRLENTADSSDDAKKLSHLGAPLPSGFVLYVCVISLILSMFLAALDIMIVTTLIDDVAKKFGAYSKTGWVFAGYSLPNAVLSLLWGRIAAVMGFKSSMLAAIVIFEVGSLIAGVANSMNMLIGGRVISGIGGSGIQSVCFLIGSTLVDERRRGMIIACLGSAFGIASVAGPFLGGAFTTHATWRWCFYINLPIGGVAFAFFLVFYNPHGGRQSFAKNWRETFSRSCSSLKNLKKLGRWSTWRFIAHEAMFRFDIVEFLVCTAGIVLVLLALSLGGNTYKWNSGSIIAMFVVGISLTILAFVYDCVVFPRLATVKSNLKYQPLVSWRNIKIPGIFTANLAVFFICTAYMCQVIYAVQYFQLIYNNSAWKASVHMIAAVVPTVLTVITSGIINSKTGFVKPITLVGVVAGLVGGGLMTLLDNHASNSEHIGLMILPGVAFGAIMQSTLIGSQIQLDKNSPTYRLDFISVTTLNAFLKNLGNAVGGIICDTVFSASIMNKLSQNNIKVGDPNSVDALIIFRANNFDGSQSLLGNLISDSIKNVFYMALGLSGAAFICGVATSNKKVDVQKQPAADEKSSEALPADEDSTRDTLENEASSSV